MKILVTGSHHCGTSILRKLIGNHPGVKDIPHELGTLKPLDKEYKTDVVAKMPNLNDQLVKECKARPELRVVCVLRDPRDAYTSLLERTKGRYEYTHSEI